MFVKDIQQTGASSNVKVFLNGGVHRKSIGQHKYLHVSSYYQGINEHRTYINDLKTFCLPISYNRVGWNGKEQCQRNKNCEEIQSVPCT